MRMSFSPKLRHVPLIITRISMDQVYAEVITYLATPRLELPEQLERQVLILHQALKQFSTDGMQLLCPTNLNVQ